MFYASVGIDGVLISFSGPFSQ